MGVQRDAFAVETGSSFSKVSIRASAFVFVNTVQRKIPRFVVALLSVSGSGAET